REVSFFDTVEEQWSGDQRGALVEGVKPGSWAELGSLSDGDLILEVDGRPVDNVDALRTELEKLTFKQRTFMKRQSNSILFALVLGLAGMATRCPADELAEKGRDIFK